jgi:hypothetical protein
MKTIPFWFNVLAAGLLLVGCEGFFGTRTDTDFIDPPNFSFRSVAYVPIQPVIEDELVRPVDVIAGFDELIYVADAGTEEIVSFDQAGNELGRFAVPGLIAIAQDRTLDLLATGTKDTVISGTPFTLAAIYRINLNKQTGPYGLNNAFITRTIIHPFYFRSGTPTGNDRNVSFPGIAIIGDGRYYIARNGPSNVPSQFGGPDDAILLFNRLNGRDTFETPVFIETGIGLARDYFKKPQGLSTFAQPIQNPGVNTSGDFAYCSISPELVIKVQIIDRNESDFGVDYRQRPFIIGDTSRADGFLYQPNRFERPVDVTFSGDGTNYLFVVDAEKDSLYQFDGNGFEGVNPPAGADATKPILVSFGGTGEGLTQFREPRGVAYLGRIVYVADAGNGRLLRFRLTTDFE